MLDKDREMELLLQWQTCIDSANLVSQRRDTLNNIFVTLNLAIVTALSTIVSHAWEIQSIPIILAGLVSCITWVCLIGNLRKLNEVKFDIINSLETNLPAQPFNMEWNILKENKQYLESSKIERALPVTFMAIYVIYVLVVIALSIGSFA